MGRRKKEPESTHRENIAAAAERLFERQGMRNTTMDDIAREAGYSKATLYVYFKDKEEMIGFLTLKSMRLLYDCLTEAVSGTENTVQKYDKICWALAEYQKQYPFYFTVALGEISVDLENADCLPVTRETYEVGEKINARLAEFIYDGIETGEFSADIPILQNVFFLWASMGGVIQMAADKEVYIEKSMHMTKRQFLKFGFEQLYRLIVKEGV